MRFCIRTGLNYVSCSPYRIPIARLAAAQQAIADGDESADATDDDNSIRESAAAGA